MTGLLTNSEYIARSKELSHRPGEPQAFGLLRSYGQKFLSQNEWPTRKHEEWKYTNTQGFATQSFEPSVFAKTSFVNKPTSDWKATSTLHLRFINGILQTPISSITGVRCLSLRDAIEKGLYPIFDMSQPKDNFEALNLSFLEEGLFIDIADGFCTETLIHLDFQSHSTPNPYVFLSRVIVRAGKNSKAVLLETYQGSHDGARSTNWTNVQIEAHLQDHARLTWARLQDESSDQWHTCRSRYYLSESSQLHQLLLSQGAAIHRHDLNIEVHGKNANAIAHGISLGTGKEHRDHNTLIDFKCGESNAEQVFKSILHGESRSVFNGKIIIRPDSQKVDSSQLNQSLLLSEKAESDSQPQLEIYADDVKATHGATVGQLNDEELFYFRSRCISEAKAKLMLTQGFAMDLVERFPNEEVRKLLREKINHKLQGFW